MTRRTSRFNIPIRQRHLGLASLPPSDDRRSIQGSHRQPRHHSVAMVMAAVELERQAKCQGDAIEKAEKPGPD